MRSGLLMLAFVAGALAAPSVSEKKPFATLPFDRYWSFDEITEYLNELTDEFPEIFLLQSVGTSQEGRPIHGVRVTNAEHLGQETLPVILVTAGASARDWISVMAAINLIHELVEHYEDFRLIVDDVEWIIIPVVNPDGYEYSRGASHRAWIKNRSVTEGSECVGVNVERNFDFNFGLPLRANDDPCSDEFRGRFADSEEETISVQFAVDAFARIQRAYITLRAGAPGAHSLIAHPFSSNNELFQSNFQERIGVGNIMTDAIWQGSGRSYRIANEGNVMGLASGTSSDYAAGRDNVPLAYTIFTRAGGPNGWDVPENQIQDIVNEVFLAFEALGVYTAGLPVPTGQSEKVDFKKLFM